MGRPGWEADCAPLALRLGDGIGGTKGDWHRAGLSLGVRSAGGRGKKILGAGPLPEEMARGLFGDL